MAALRAYLHGAPAARQADPRALVSTLNDLLYESVPAGRFATLFYGVYDIATRTLEYVNAGHLPPVVLRPRDGGWQHERLTAGGLATGLMRGTRYESDRVALEPGALLMTCTDGITEAMDVDGGDWGEDGLLAVLDRCAHRSAHEIVASVLAAADAFAHGAAQHDDMTVAVVRVI
jgi:sigma-B regulation protein RsbU (phosphoserine phosphatase)